MKLQRHRHLLGGVILVAGCAVLLSGCLGFGGGDSADATTGTLRHAPGRHDGRNRSPMRASSRSWSLRPTSTRASRARTRSSSSRSSPTTTQQHHDSRRATHDHVDHYDHHDHHRSSSTTTTSSTSTTSTSSSTTSTTSFFTHMLQVLSGG